MILIAHDIRSLHNVGAIFRSADAFGVEKLYLTGYTETPPRKEIAKVALGSQDRVAWEKRENILELIDELKNKGVQVYGLDNREGAIDIHAVIARPAEFSAEAIPNGYLQPGGIASLPSVARNDVALILGNEVEGLPETVVKACSALVQIPMPGQKKSLNVAVATGIALFALTSKNG